MNNIKFEKPSFYKLCITVCLAMILSLFIFACGSSKDTGSGATTDSASNVIQDTSGAMRDTSTMNPDTSSSNRIPPDSMH
jgi:hypothetical protein